jgi:hypothetical protein
LDQLQELFPPNVFKVQQPTCWLPQQQSAAAASSSNTTQSSAEGQQLPACFNELTVQVLRLVLLTAVYKALHSDCKAMARALVAELDKQPSSSAAATAAVQAAAAAGGHPVELVREALAIFTRGPVKKLKQAQQQQQQQQQGTLCATACMTNTNTNLISFSRYKHYPNLVLQTAPTNLQVQVGHLVVWMSQGPPPDWKQQQQQQQLGRKRSRQQQQQQQQQQEKQQERYVVAHLDVADERHVKLTYEQTGQPSLEPAAARCLSTTCVNPRHMYYSIAGAKCFSRAYHAVRQHKKAKKCLSRGMCEFYCELCAQNGVNYQSGWCVWPASRITASP